MNSITSIDYARYGKCRSEDTPKPQRMQKTEILEELRKNNESFNSNATVKGIRTQLRDLICANLKI